MLEKQPAGQTLLWKFQIQRRVISSPRKSICSSVQWPAAYKTNLTINTFPLQSSQFRDSILQFCHRRQDQDLPILSWMRQTGSCKSAFPWPLCSFRSNVHKFWLWFHKNTLRSINLVIWLQRSIWDRMMPPLKKVGLIPPGQPFYANAVQILSSYVVTRTSTSLQFNLLKRGSYKEVLPPCQESSPSLCPYYTSQLSQKGEEIYGWSTTKGF